MILICTLMKEDSPQDGTPSEGVLEKLPRLIANGISFCLQKSVL